MKIEFISFLKKHKAYSKWYKYSKQNQGNGVISFLDNTKPRSYLTGAFVWMDVSGKENRIDHVYWENLNCLWYNELNKLGL